MRCCTMGICPKNSSKKIFLRYYSFKKPKKPSNFNEFLGEEKKFLCNGRTLLLKSYIIMAKISAPIFKYFGSEDNNEKF